LKICGPADPPTPTNWGNCRARLREFFDSRVAPAIGPKLGDVSALTLVGTGGPRRFWLEWKGLERIVREEIEGRASLANASLTG